MPVRMRPRNLSILLGSVAVIVVILAVVVLASSSHRATGASARAAKVLRVGGPLHVQPIQPGFVGQSFEYQAIERYAGTDPKAIDSVFERLTRNLADDQPPSIRIGGDSTDLTWAPIAGVPKPAGVRSASRRDGWRSPAR